jgi:5'-nucleotidase
MGDLKFQNRRSFLKYALGTAGSFYLLPAFAQENLLFEKGIEKLTILYTNDQHSRIEPFPANDTKHPGEGGFSKRAALIEQIKKEEKNVLLLDAGDIFQGTPYFNYFHGELEYKLMSLMGYDAVTFGNHDFDLGVENIIKQMPHAGFDFINCNYNFNDTDLKDYKKINPYRIYKKGNLKIGIVGVGIDLEGLIAPKQRQGLIYTNPIEQANKAAFALRIQERCDFVICLSHLGYMYDSDKVSDIQLARNSENIDLIIGGHTHTFLNEPFKTLNRQAIEVQVTQVGWAGIWLGRIDLYFTNSQKYLHQTNTVHTVSQG